MVAGGEEELERLLGGTDGVVVEAARELAGNFDDDRAAVIGGKEATEEIDVVDGGILAWKQELRFGRGSGGVFEVDEGGVGAEVAQGSFEIQALQFEVAVVVGKADARGAGAALEPL